MASVATSIAVPTASLRGADLIALSAALVPIWAKRSRPLRWQSAPLPPANGVRR